MPCSCVYKPQDTAGHWGRGGEGWGRDSRRDPGTGQLQAAGSEQLSMLGAGDASLTVLALGY